MPNRVIYKFPHPRGLKTIDVRTGAQVVLVDHQHGEPMIWVELDLEAPEETWTIHSVATGEPNRIQENWEHLGSVVVRPEAGSYGRILVWHLYKENI